MRRLGGGERCGPLAIARYQKRDGRALLLYRHADADLNADADLHADANLQADADLD